MKIPVNMNLSQCQFYVLQYKHNTCPKACALLIAQYDKLIVKYIYSYRKKFGYVRHLPMQELYHMALVAMFTSFKACKDDMHPKWYPQWIKSYIKASFRTLQTYRSKEELVAEIFTGCRDKNIERTLASLDIDYLFSLGNLTEEEHTYICDKYIKELTYKQIAEKTKESISTIHFKINRGLEKLRSLLNKTKN